MAKRADDLDAWRRNELPAWRQYLLLRIRTLRDLANLSQTELAEKIGCTQSTVALWECGQGTPSVADLRTIASICGVKLPGDAVQRALEIARVFGLDFDNLFELASSASSRTPRGRPGRPRKRPPQPA